MKYTFPLFLLLLLSCKSHLSSKLIEQKATINTTLNAWHKAAADANFDAYFDMMTNHGVFVGTDLTENWQQQAFKTFSKPYFDKGKAWSFVAVERNIYFSDDYKTAWFDELLTTQMKICRGSGVLIQQNGKWKIAHYVLSMTIPNKNTNEVVTIKTNFDENLLRELLKR
jgi:ketosteroid isomerase-like protein